MTDELKPCPWCGKNAVHVAVCDDEGNYHGELGCEYEKDAWSGLSYALYHDGWGNCILCTDGRGSCMGGVLFDTAQEAIDEWNYPICGNPNLDGNENGMANDEKS